jgi:hypothetical protein
MRRSKAEIHPARLNGSANVANSARSSKVITVSLRRPIEAMGTTLLFDALQHLPIRMLSGRLLADHLVVGAVCFLAWASQ